MFAGRPFECMKPTIDLLVKIEKMLEFLVEAGFNPERLQFLVPMSKMRGTNEEKAQMRHVISNFLARLLKGTFPDKKHYAYFRHVDEGFEEVIHFTPLIVYLAHRIKERSDEVLITARQSAWLCSGAWPRMAHFFEMEARKDEVVKNFFARTQDASDSLPHEVAAVTKIQSVHRATQIRIIYHAVVAAARLIQRMVRGCLGRKKARDVSQEGNNHLRLKFFHHCACTIQRMYRGRWSRKRVHSFYGRKIYLEKVEKRGEWTKEYLAEEHKELIAEKLAAAKIQEEQRVKEEFDHLAGDLHHLMSTKTIPGVYNPPYSDLLPRAFEKPIEEHLRDACLAKIPASLKRARHKSASTTRSARFGMSQAEMSQDEGAMPPQDLPNRAPHFSRAASSGRLQKNQGPFRSKEQIEVANVKAANMYRAKLSKMARSSPLDFRAAGNKEKPAPSSVHVGIPFPERPVDLRSDFVELPKIRDKPPFFTAHPGGKQFGDYDERHLLPHGHT
eukprot:s2532_g2.t1